MSLESIVRLPSPVVPLNIPEIENDGIQLWMKLEAKIHPIFGGNKYRKLKYNLKAFDRGRFKAVISFGGLHSNHIYALAGITKEIGISCIGIIRGEESIFSPTIKFAKEKGMDIIYVSRESYRNKEQLLLDLGYNNEYLVIPEGGTNQLAIKGCSEIVQEVNGQFETSPPWIAVPFGTGGTSLGILEGMNNRGNLLIFPALKGDWMEAEMNEICPRHSKNFKVISNYHFGGYGKFTPELIQFIERFYKQTGIPLDPIYTGKMMFGIVDLVKTGYFNKGEQIVVVHTGGIQGNVGFNQRFGTNLPTSW